MANDPPHRAQLIQMLLKDFHWDQFEHPPYSLNLMPSDYHLFYRLKEELGGQCFQTQEELLLAVANICTKLRKDF